MLSLRRREVCTRWLSHCSKGARTDSLIDRAEFDEKAAARKTRHQLITNSTMANSA